MEERQEYKFQGTGLEASEKRLAHIKFDEYCKHCNVTSFSDKQILEEIVFCEVVQDRMKKNIAEKKSKAVEEKKDYNVPTYIVEAMKSNMESIITLKEKVGLLKDASDVDDGFNYIQQLEEKFKKWCQENQDRTFACPHCSKMVLLYMKQEYWETMKHPFFESKVLGNKKLWELYKINKITKTEMSEVLGCSEKYIEWLESKMYLKPPPPSV